MHGSNDNANPVIQRKKKIMPILVPRKKRIHVFMIDITLMGHI